MSTTAESYLVGLIGDGVMPSLTPGMHEREADAQGLRYLYRPIDLTVLERPGSDVGARLKAGEQLGFNAFNITHPCKQLVLEHLDEISQNARDIGAVNTVVIRDGKFHGYNTDASGSAAASPKGCPEPTSNRSCSWEPAAPDPPWPTRCWRPEPSSCSWWTRTRSALGSGPRN